MSATGKRARGRFAAAALTAAWLLCCAQTEAQDRRVSIVNGTRHAIVKFFASNASAGGWEADILGRRVLRAGQSVTIDMDDGSGECLFDFKAVFDDGDEVVKRGIDVCKTGSYRYTE